MSLNRVLRYLAGLFLASLLLGLILPLFGIVPAKFLPPPLAYAKAEGLTKGVIINKMVEPTGNPFKVGDHVYHVFYAFRAPPPLLRGETKPGPSQRYYGEAHVDEATYNASDKDGIIPHIRYEKTYPDINGIDDPAGGRSIGPGSNLVSGWLLFLLLDLALAFGFMTLLERFGKQEDI